MPEPEIRVLIFRGAQCIGAFEAPRLRYSKGPDPMTRIAIPTLLLALAGAGCAAAPCVAPTAEQIGTARAAEVAPTGASCGELAPDALRWCYDRRPADAPPECGPLAWSCQGATLADGRILFAELDGWIVDDGAGGFSGEATLHGWIDDAVVCVGTYEITID